MPSEEFICIRQLVLLMVFCYFSPVNDVISLMKRWDIPSSTNLEDNQKPSKRDLHLQLQKEDTRA